MFLISVDDTVDWSEAYLNVSRGAEAVRPLHQPMPSSCVISRRQQVLKERERSEFRAMIYESREGSN